MSSSSSRAVRALNRTLAAALTVLLVTACAAPATDAPRASPSAAATEERDGSASVTASVDADQLMLTTADGARSVVATVEDAELLHAAVRPGVTDPVTVLALTRTDDRYELRYLSVADGAPTDLFWFPARLQVSSDTIAVTDVPTLPVWAPDGSALAWLEWDQEGTRLRTVGWFDHDLGTNPSDEQATYDVADVPAGSQLAAWVDEDGTPLLVTRGEGEDRWHIRIEEGEPVVALEQVP